MSHKYIVFAWEMYSESGGLGDWVADCSTVEQANALVKKLAEGWTITHGHLADEQLEITHEWDNKRMEFLPV
jgi:hypothetical protein